MRLAKFLLAIFSTLLCLAALTICARAWADETCNSPYLSTLIHGQEDYLDVWTLGVAGMGDGSDKLVTLDVRPGSKTYGKVIAQASVGVRVRVRVRGASCGLHRRSPLPVGRWPEQQ